MEGLIFGMLRYVMYCYPYTTLHRFRSLGISSFFQVETELSGGGEGGVPCEKEGIFVEKLDCNINGPGHYLLAYLLT